jgi:heat-inducible transcriptional repressor
LTAANPSLRLHHIDFVSLEGTRVLVIVVATGGQITHKVIDTDQRCAPAVLSQAANYINSEFAGLTLQEARTAIVARMREERSLYDALMARALMLAQNGLADVTPEASFHLQGASFIVEELAGGASNREQTIETLRALFRMIEEKHRFVELLTRSIEAGGLTVVIGSEHASPDLHPFSLVTATFQDGDRSGTVGVIGPTRMRYHRAITVVDSISRTVTRLLEGQ